jgi:hypothetical protein
MNKEVAAIPNSIFTKNNILEVVKRNPRNTKIKQNFKI